MEKNQISMTEDNLMDKIYKELGKTKCEVCDCYVFNMKRHLRTDKHAEMFQLQVESDELENWGINT